MMQPLTVSFPDERFAVEYGDLLSALRACRRTVATMDLLIATFANLGQAALVTANRKPFESIPALNLLDYRSGGRERLQFVAVVVHGGAS